MQVDILRPLYSRHPKKLSIFSFCSASGFDPGILRCFIKQPSPEYFLLWLKHALTTIRCSLRTFGALIQKSAFLAIIGESGAGKNLLLSAIIIPVLGADLSKEISSQIKTQDSKAR